MTAIVQKPFKAKNGNVFQAGHLIFTTPEKLKKLVDTGFVTLPNPGTCLNCQAFRADEERGYLGMGFCSMKGHGIWATNGSGCIELLETTRGSKAGMEGT